MTKKTKQNKKASPPPEECKKLKVAVLVESKQRERLFRNFIFHFTVLSPERKDFKLISNQSPEQIEASYPESLRQQHTFTSEVVARWLVQTVQISPL